MKTNDMRTTSLPSCLLLVLAKKFTQAEVRKIDMNWNSYVSMNITCAYDSEIIKAARMVLDCLEAEKA